MLTLALVCLYLPVPAGILGEVASNAAGASGSAEIPYYIPFAITCCLACFAVLVFWGHAGTNRALGPDEKRNWRWLLLLLAPVAAPRYWARFR